MKWIFDQSKALAPRFAGRPADAAVKEAAAQMRSPESAAPFDISDPRNETYLRWAGLCGVSGLPIVRFSTPEYAASLCCTSVPIESMAHVLPPWTTFALLVPPELQLEMMGQTINFVGVMFDSDAADNGRAWTHIAMHVGEQSRKFASYTFTSSEDLCTEIDTDSAPGVDAHDRRVTLMLGRLIASTCMAFTGGSVSRVSSKAHRAKRSSLPTRWEFIARAEVKVNALSFVHDYVAGQRRGPVAVQTLVRGHWKHQPHGHLASERKFIHIEPYWRGPEDAPIVSRAHLVGAATQSKSPDDES